MATFAELWRAYSEGRLERSLDLVDPACEFVMLDGTRTYTGHDGVRAWLADVRQAWKTLLISYDAFEQPYDGCVIASGRVTASSEDGGRTLESPLVCVATFRDGRLVAGRGFRAREDADRWAAAQRG